MGILNRFARPALLAVGSLLLAGVLLTVFNLLLIGWSVYAVGHVGAIGAFLLVGYAYRSRMDGWAWAGLGVLVIGLVLALPQVASIWLAYSSEPTGRDMLLPSAEPPVGAVAEIVTWVGLAFYGLAARGTRALPPGVGWVFVLAAAVGVLATVGLITPLAWAVAMLLVAFGLVAVGSGFALPERDGHQLPAVESLT